VQYGGIGAVVEPMSAAGTWFPPSVRRWICAGTALSSAKRESPHVQQKLAARLRQARRVSRHGL
jgi:hypothetical protein